MPGRKSVGVKGPCPHPPEAVDDAPDAGADAPARSLGPEAGPLRPWTSGRIVG